MHGGGRFPRPAFFIAQNDDLGAPLGNTRTRRQDHAGRIQMAVSWKTAPPLGGPGSALVKVLMPLPSSKAAFGQMLSTTTTPGCRPSKGRAWTTMLPRRLPR